MPEKSTDTSRIGTRSARPEGEAVGHSKRCEGFGAFWSCCPHKVPPGVRLCESCEAAQRRTAAAQLTAFTHLFKVHS